MPIGPSNTPEYPGLTAEESVRHGRAALDHWLGSYPWYNPSNDGVRPIDVSPTWYERLFAWLSQFLPTSFSWPKTPWEWAAWIGMAGLLGLLGWILYRVYRQRRAASAAGGEAAGTGQDEAAEAQRRSEALPAPAARQRTDLLGEARRHYEAGRYDEAIIYLFSHELVELDKFQLVRLAKGKTNRQYLGELAPRAALRQILELSMITFEEVFFGGRSIDRTRFEACWSRLADFQSLAAEGAVVASW